MAQDGTKSDAEAEWGGLATTGLSEDVPALLAPPQTVSCIAMAVPHLIRFVWTAKPGAVVYYHHGRLYEDSLKDPLVRHRGRYVALAVEFGLLHPRQARSDRSHMHYYAVRTDASMTGQPVHVFGGAITPDEFKALTLVRDRQSHMSAARAIRDGLGTPNTQATEICAAMIRRGWITNTGATKLTDLGRSLLT